MKTLYYSLLACLVALFATKTSPVEQGRGTKPEVIEKIELDDSSFILVVDEEQEKIIREIILTMARYNPIKLGFKKKHLSNLGKQLKGLGPLQFLGYVGSQTDLRRALKRISKSSLKWKGFVGGMSKGLDKAHEKKTLFKQLPSFASFIDIDEKVLTEHAKKRDWSAFIQSIAIEKSP